MRILLTGASGRLGSHVCRYLHEAGCEVVAADVKYNRDLPVKIQVTDLLDHTEAYRLMHGCEAVVHLGNHPGMHMGVPPQKIYSENITMNINIFQAAVDLGIKKLVFASSVQVISGNRKMDDTDKPTCLKYLPVDDQTPPSPGNLYACSKVAGELLLQHLCGFDESLGCCAIRFPFLLSAEHLDWFRRVHTTGDPPHWTKPDEVFAYLLMPDAAALVYAVIQNMTPGYYQCMPAADECWYNLPVAELIERYYQGVTLRKPVDQLHCLVDTSAITERFGWRPGGRRIHEILAGSS